MCDLLHELVRTSAARDPDAAALVAGKDVLDYATLEARIERTARGLTGETALARGTRVAIWLDKRVPTVLAMFAASRAGGVFVPVNPVLKEEQALHILRDCTASVLVTSSERLARLTPRLAQEAPSVRHVVLIDGVPAAGSTDWRDASYDVSELIFFDDVKGQDTYQIHPIHEQFVAHYAQLWKKVVVYDSIEVEEA
jgi:acyl-CoA synthetase (AMP-forming)/AMP-acid ligase II